MTNAAAVTDETEDAVSVDTPPAASVRGCGRRIRGGIYAEVDATSAAPPEAADPDPTITATEPDPVAALFEACLLDPPIPVDTAALGLSAIGVTLIETVASDHRPVTHVFDIVGETHYPNVASLIDEARTKGVSRRLARSLDFSRLEAGRSRLVLVHARGWIENAAAYFRARTSSRWPCPKFIHAHLDRDNPPEMCSSLFWEDLDGPRDPSGERSTVVRCGDTTSVGRRPPDGVTRRYRHAIIGSFPISRLAVISDPLGASHDVSVRSASRSSISVEIVPS